MRDQLVRWDHFFSTACSTPVSARNGSINTPQVVVNRFTIDMGAAKSAKDYFQRSITIPLVIEAVNRSPFTILLRKITPRRASAKYQQNGIKCQAAIGRWSPSCLGRRKQILDAFPLRIG
jgi:hypothetical protein